METTRDSKGKAIITTFADAFVLLADMEVRAIQLSKDIEAYQPQAFPSFPTWLWNGLTGRGWA